MTFYKKHTGAEGIVYQEALEEALCFGWIDSLIKKLDEDRYVRKFSPRTNLRKWSDINLKITERLIREGRMTPTGLEKMGDYLVNGIVVKQEKQDKPVRKDMVIPEYILETLAAHEPALTNFLKLPSSCKREYAGWITQAKREETILKRLQETISLLKENKRLGLK